MLQSSRGAPPHLRLVHFTAGRLARRSRRAREHLPDLIQEGSVALLVASKAYDPRRAAPSSYFVACITTAMLDWLRKEHRVERRLAPLEAAGDVVIPTEEPCVPSKALRRALVARAARSDALDRAILAERLLGPATLQSLACRFGVTRQAVSLREHAIIRELKRALEVGP